MRSLIESLESRVHLSLAGDANQDGRVDSLDFAAVAVNFNQHPRTLAQGDFTGDALVNALDFGVLATNFGRQDVPLTVNNYTAGASGDENTWETGANWSLGHKPLSTENATINAATAGAMPSTLSVTETIGQLTITDGDANDFTTNGTLNVLGDVGITNGSIITLGAVGGSVTGEGNLGELTIASLTGVGKDLDVVASSVVVTSFAANADYTVGGSTPGDLTVNAGAASSILRFTGSSQTNVPQASLNNWHGQAVANKVGSTACPVNLVASILPADATLTSQLNGVTVTDGTGGTIRIFTKLRASGLDNTEATVTGGVEKTHARGSTYHGTYNIAWGFLPNQVTIGNYSGNPIVISASGGNWSVALPDDLDLGSSQDVTLSIDGDTALLIDTITVTAAASNTPQTRLDYGFGLGFGFIRSANKRELLRR